MKKTGELVYLNKKAFVTKQNTIRYFDDGKKFFEAQVKALESAKYFIFLEFFIVRSGKALNQIIDILSEKAKSGVKVYFLYDAIGSFCRIKKADKEKLLSSGVNFAVSIPIELKWLKYANNRDHRKIIVIDDEIAFTGGTNLADEYIHEETRFGDWHDSGLMLKGESVSSFSDIFISMWNNISDKKLKKVKVREKHSKNGKKSSKSSVAVFVSEPKSKNKERIAKNIYINAINSAQKYLYISTPYLVCDAEILGSIARSAMRGVDVRLALPRITDKPLVFKVGRSYYNYLISSGVKIYEYLPGIVHSKNLITDDSVAISGTINFDYRSFDIDYECAVWTNSRSFVKSVKSDFRNIFTRSELIKFGDFKSKSALLTLTSPLKKQF